MVKQWLQNRSELMNVFFFKYFNDPFFPSGNIVKIRETKRWLGGFVVVVFFLSFFFRMINRSKSALSKDSEIEAQM